jgi:hypothetical protein
LICFEYDLKFSRRWLWRIPSSGILQHVALVKIDVSEERIPSIIRVTRIGELGTTLAVTSNRSTSRRNTITISSPRWFLHGPHGVTSQKMAFSIYSRNVFITYAAVPGVICRKKARFSTQALASVNPLNVPARQNGAWPSHYTAATQGSVEVNTAAKPSVFVLSTPITSPRFVIKIGHFFCNFPFYLQAAHIYVHSANGMIKMAWRGALNSTPPWETGTVPMMAAGKKR